mmetsp:Transcript_2943/g.3102  ORF Transcript_2943/g.3102 Transcript_2943/m.3102 type:complete len:350 (-) Transcript_2943:109-1158(-)
MMLDFFIISFTLTTWLMQINSAVVSPVLMELDNIVQDKIYANQPKTYCYETGLDYPRDPSRIFSSVQFSVNSVNNIEFGFHKVRGLSTDDFHSHIEWLVFKILKINPPDERELEIGHDLDKFEGFVRDIFSACPTPFSRTHTSCLMSFSPYGRSCITVDSSTTIPINVMATKGFDVRYLQYFIGGVSLLLLSTLLSKSKLFQYTAGSFIFVVGGVIVLAIYLNRRFSPKKTSAGNFLTFLFSAAYMYTVKMNLKGLLLNYWEYVLGYIAVMIVLGFIFIGVARSFDSSKSVLRFSVKWILRIQGLILMYNGFASPLLSILMFCIVCIIFFIIFMIESSDSLVTDKRKIQ